MHLANEHAMQGYPTIHMLMVPWQAVHIAPWNWNKYTAYMLDYSWGMSSCKRPRSTICILSICSHIYLRTRMHVYVQLYIPVQTHALHSRYLKHGWGVCAQAQLHTSTHCTATSKGCARVRFRLRVLFLSFVFRRRVASMQACIHASVAETFQRQLARYYLSS